VTTANSAVSSEMLDRGAESAIGYVQVRPEQHPIIAGVSWLVTAPYRRVQATIRDTASMVTADEVCEPDRRRLRRGHGTGQGEPCERGMDILLLGPAAISRATPRFLGAS
jgi:hypothetical protein